MSLSISLHTHPESEEEAVKITEVLSRAAAGLAFDGVACGIQFTTYEPDSD